MVKILDQEIIKYLKHLGWFKDWLPPYVALDGELFLGRESFEQCGLFRRKVPNDDEWRHAQVKYQIFDAPN